LILRKEIFSLRGRRAKVGDYYASTSEPEKISGLMSYEGINRILSFPFFSRCAKFSYLGRAKRHGLLKKFRYSLASKKLFFTRLYGVPAHFFKRPCRFIPDLPQWMQHFSVYNAQVSINAFWSLFLQYRCLC
jgi:hypothetical protein